MVTVHVGEEEKAYVRTLAHLPEVHGQWRVGNEFPVHFQSSSFQKQQQESKKQASETIEIVNNAFHLYYHTLTMKTIKTYETGLTVADSSLHSLKHTHVCTVLLADSAS